MGPYCKFCNRRCFVPLPLGTPPEIVKAYGSSTIIATCPAGQAFEKERVGYCHDDIHQVLKARTAACTPSNFWSTEPDRR